VLYALYRKGHQVADVEFAVAYLTYMALLALGVFGKGTCLYKTEGRFAHLEATEVTIG
jgi:hypothetical protein